MVEGKWLYSLHIKIITVGVKGVVISVELLYLFNLSLFWIFRGDCNCAAPFTPVIVILVQWEYSMSTWVNE